MAEINMANSLGEARLFSGGWPERALTQINSRRITKFGSLAMFAAMQFNWCGGCEPQSAQTRLPTPAVSWVTGVAFLEMRIGNALAWLNCFTKS